MLGGGVSRSRALAYFVARHNGESIQQPDFRPTEKVANDSGGLTWTIWNKPKKHDAGRSRFSLAIDQLSEIPIKREEYALFASRDSEDFAIRRTGCHFCDRCDVDSGRPEIADRHAWNILICEETTQAAPRSLE